MEKNTSVIEFTLSDIKAKFQLVDYFLSNDKNIMEDLPGDDGAVGCEFLIVLHMLMDTAIQSFYEFCGQHPELAESEGTGNEG